MKRSSLLEQLANEQFECYYRKNGVYYDYDGSFCNLSLIAENPATQIRELALPGEDMLTVELLSHNLRTVITLNFFCFIKNNP